ncbi:FUSC family protein [Legionella fallonii]|uniref:Putative membrane protein n=1 Tax=Legionella fallonii LLAP-10 TaxID=1212491 RepID=A0A098G290_9GAMM|nr:FUSC family protein [Legionella fallonii]CEG56084.1 putative membrane protein [Legionella fallonii LLAP-10]
MQINEFLLHELSPRAGRIANVSRITVLTILVIILSETFQIPEPAYSAYIVFFISKEEKASTLLTAIIVMLAITISVFSALAIYTISVGEPGLRLPLMAVIVFLGMFISRISSIGIVAFVIGFLVTLSLTLIDIVPPLASMPSTEILTRSVLWLWVVAMLPVSLVFVGNILAGRAPIELFNTGLIDRFQLAGQSLIGARPVIDPKQFYAKANMGVLLNYLKMAGLLQKEIKQKTSVNRAIVALTGRLMMLLAELGKLPIADIRLLALKTDCGVQLLSLAQAMTSQTEYPQQNLIIPDYEGNAASDSKAFLLLSKITAVVNTLAELLGTSRSDTTDEQEKSDKEHSPLIVPDAFSNPDYVHYALKTTLAIFIAYFTYTMLSWPEIRTCMITCFFVALGSMGETGHKMILRLVGALIGGGLGLAAIVFIMPYITTITGLCIIIALVSFFAAWVATSSELLSYAGLQIALAFFVSILVGYGPTIDLTSARDRIIGILLGNIIVFLVFSAIWPTRAIRQARLAFASAVDKLSQFFSLSNQQEQGDALFFSLQDSLSQASRLIVLNAFEPERAEDEIIRVGMSLIEQVQTLSSIAMIVSEQNREGLFTETTHAELIHYNQLLGKWLMLIAKEIQRNEFTALEPPNIAPLIHSFQQANSAYFAHPLFSAYASWYQSLDVEVSEFKRLIDRLIFQGHIMLHRLKEETR